MERKKLKSRLKMMKLDLHNRLSEVERNMGGLIDGCSTLSFPLVSDTGTVRNLETYAFLKGQRDMLSYSLEKVEQLIEAILGPMSVEEREEWYYSSLSQWNEREQQRFWANEVVDGEK